MRTADRIGWCVDRIFMTLIPGTSNDVGKEGNMVEGAVGPKSALSARIRSNMAANQSSGGSLATTCDFFREGEITFGGALVHTGRGAECFFTERSRVSVSSRSEAAVTLSEAKGLDSAKILRCAQNDTVAT